MGPISKDNYKICKNCNKIIRMKDASFCPKCGKPLQKCTEKDMLYKSIIDFNGKVYRSLVGWKELNSDDYDLTPLTCEVFYNGKPISELKVEDL